ncbi:hypothetical protein AXG93_2139s1360 [Marchantia polymorpha subsp. ruderalis]|uniref:Uncharacterized protein n=1 Tax=Marchantia polymorpha subsp. ruderalis TaxID=1480154 RepID=A0A176WLU0_MARPO|nr:hypothetical protein AXG93_2139s1360 [Marchantia polymorpha subsp. ruderalis]
MHCLSTTDRGGGRTARSCSSRRRRRSFRDFALCDFSLISFLLLLLVIVVQACGASAGNEFNVVGVRHSGASQEGIEVEEIPELGTWNALTHCIRDSKEERALERWLFCVEVVRSRELSGIPLHVREAEAIIQRNAVSNVYSEWSRTELIEAREGRWRPLMDLRQPEDQLECAEPRESERAQRPKLLLSKDGPVRGDSGLFAVEDAPRSAEKGSVDGLEMLNIDSRKCDSVSTIENNGGRGFVSGSAGLVSNSSDNDSTSRDYFLSYRADENQGSSSDSGEEVEQVLAASKGSGGRDYVQQHSEMSVPPANSIKAEPLKPSNAGGIVSQGGLVVEKEQVSTTSEQDSRSNDNMTGAVTYAAIVGALTLMLGAQLGRGRQKPKKQSELSSGRWKSTMKGSARHVEDQFPMDLQKLSEPLGMAVAQVLFEVLEQNRGYHEGSLSAESLSHLLESALTESLMPVLGDDRSHFVDKFRESFSSTYRTRAGVRCAFLRAGTKQTPNRQASAKPWRGSQPKSRRETYNEQNCDEVERSSANREDNFKKPLKVGGAHKALAAPPRHQEKALDSSSDQGITSFFSTTRYEQDGQSDCAGSSTGNYYDGSSLAQISQAASGSRGENTSYFEGECSQDERMYSADDSSGSEEWIVLEGQVKQSEAVRRMGSAAVEHSSRHQYLGYEKSTDEQDRLMAGSADMASTKHRTSSSVGAAASSVDSQWEGGPFGNRGLVTPTLDLSDQTLDIENYLDLTSGRGPKDYMERSLNRLAGDSLLHSRRPNVASQTTTEDSRYSSLRTPEHNTSLHGRRGTGEGLIRESVSADNSGIRYRGTPPHSKVDRNESSSLSIQDALVLASSSNVVGYNAALDERYNLFERSVAAQEHHNRLLTWELHHKMKGLAIKEQHLHLHSESNSLMKDNVDLSRTKVEFKENELQDRKLTLAYYNFNRTCADELVAGLCVMLTALSFSFWKFSYDRLTTVVTVCQPSVRETHEGGWMGTNWMYNSLNLLTYQMQAFMCEAAKLSRMVFGIIVIAMVTSTLLRRSVTSSSQAMPAIVLGGMCGFAGKISIDSLGGSGIHWLVLWECLCLIHALATCFTSLLYHFLHGDPGRNYFEKASLASRISTGITFFAFHSVLVFFLPVMAGLLPFASPEDIMQIFFDWWSPGTPRSQYRVIP